MAIPYSVVVVRGGLIRSLNAYIWTTIGEAKSITKDRYTKTSL